MQTIRLALFKEGNVNTVTFAWQVHCAWKVASCGMQNADTETDEYSVVLCIGSNLGLKFGQEPIFAL